MPEVSVDLTTHGHRYLKLDPQAVSKIYDKLSFDVELSSLDANHRIPYSSPGDQYCHVRDMNVMS